MKYAISFSILGASLLALGLAIGNRTALVLTGWPALAFLGLAVAYAGAGPKTLGKRGGRIAWWSLILFAPLHALNQTLFHAVRLRGGQPYAEIAPDIYLGRRLSSGEAGIPSFVGVLDLTAEFAEPRALRESPGYRCIPLLDATAPDAERLAAGVRHVRDELERGPVFVHCAMGHGRSALFVAAYLVAAMDLTPDQAWTRCRDKRPGVKPTPDQRRTLEEFAAAS